MVMVYFAWDESFSVGNEAVDAQHRRLIDMVNTLQRAVSNGDGGELVQEALSSLCEYAQEHFAEEEAVMARVGYVGLEAHRAQHDAFRERIQVLLADLEHDNAYLPQEVLGFLKDWLASHILEEDHRAKEQCAS